MVPPDDDAELSSRPPTVGDLAALCRRLNEESAAYVVIGGMAMIQAGFVRATEDIDLLVEASPQNQERIRRALMSLPDQAVRDVRPEDLAEYQVVRVADEIVVDLMIRASEIDYAAARESVRIVELRGVPIPFASPELLYRMKQTLREKDKLDLLFLTALLQKTPPSDQ